MTVEDARELLLEAVGAGEDALDRLDREWPEIVVLCSAEPSARTRLADLRDTIAALADENEGAHWIGVILGVLHDEPFVAVEPATGLGIAGQMSGVVDNFQLHVLLMAEFPASPRRFGRRARRVSESAAAVARGDGPQSTDETLTGAWNLYNYTAFRGERLPAPDDLDSHDHWIWGEGIPADIPRLDGNRVILLGEPSYMREFGSQRTFPDLPASLGARELAPNEVAEWLTRIERRNAAGV